jgi:hypothetical protein
LYRYPSHARLLCFRPSLRLSRRPGRTAGLWPRSSHASHTLRLFCLSRARRAAPVRLIDQAARARERLRIESSSPSGPRVAAAAALPDSAARLDMPVPGQRSGRAPGKSRSHAWVRAYAERRECRGRVELGWQHKPPSGETTRSSTLALLAHACRATAPEVAGEGKTCPSPPRGVRLRYLPTGGAGCRVACALCQCWLRVACRPKPANR